ncbi:MAG: hypothetical protein A4E73_00155 [Syntrophaceae bacterium PtaU1.Bin231]|nr:MAG: hypothetical protein A4E73_00155 [Syntrophaceae bacterium PtaU1.Bin231]
MDEAVQTPRFFSAAFHCRFFPSVLRRIFTPARTAESPFAHHIPLEFTVITVFALFACLLGFAAVIGSGSIAGWVFALLGTAGLVFAVVHGIRSRAGEKPSYDHFRPGVFFFLIVLGFTLGLATGHTWRLSFWPRLLPGIAGAAAGYVLGIGGGLAVQYLGWLAGLIELAAYLATIGTVVVAMLLLL